VNSSNQQISQLETGRRRLNVDWLERLSKGLECHPMELLYDKVMAKTEQEEALFPKVPGPGALVALHQLSITTVLAENSPPGHRAGTVSRPVRRAARSLFKSDYCAGATSKNDG
jgi:hypothetical protein